jgi:hypothetical protein
MSKIMKLIECNSSELLSIYEQTTVIFKILFKYYRARKCLAEKYYE